MAKMGRPTVYKPEFCELAIEFFKDGKSMAEFARHLDVARSSVFEWMKLYPDFSNAVNKAVEYSEAEWIAWGRQNIGNKDFNARLYELNMMNRFSWMRKAEQKHDVTVRQEDALKDLE